jgi:Tol biopolymer transport system component
MLQPPLWLPASVDRCPICLVVLVCAGFAPIAAQGNPQGFHTVSPPTADVHGFEVVPRGERIVYLANREVEDMVELYSVKSHGGPSVKLNAPLRPGFDVVDFIVSPQGRRIVYFGQFYGRFDLFSVSVDGGPAIQLNPRDGGGVAHNPVLATAAFSPDGKRVVFLAQEDGRVELFTVSASGGTPVRISPPLASFGDVYPGIQISPDGERAVFRADPAVDFVFELFSAPIDGSRPAVQLSSALVFGRAVETIFHVSPDSARVVYVANQEMTGAGELFSVPIDGSSPAVKLNGPLVAGGNVHTTGLTSDGHTVVYMADERIDEDEALFAVPIDGSASPVLISDGLYFVAGYDDYFGGPRFLVAPGAGRAVYQSDRALDSAYELFSAPLDASSPPVAVSGPLAAGGSIAYQYQATLDGGRVLYIADQDADQVFELFSAPANGSASPIKLNAPLPEHADVLSFSLGPDGTNVVYRTGLNGSLNDDARLFAARVDGSAPAVDLCGAFVPGGGVLDFALTSDGQRVVYSADQLTQWVFELFSVPIDGSQAPQRIVGF